MVIRKTYIKAKHVITEYEIWTYLCKFWKKLNLNLEMIFDAGLTIFPELFWIICIWSDRIWAWIFKYELGIKNW